MRGSKMPFFFTQCIVLVGFWGWVEMSCTQHNHIAIAPPAFFFTSSFARRRFLWHCLSHKAIVLKSWGLGKGGEPPFRWTCEAINQSVQYNRWGVYKPPSWREWIQAMTFTKASTFFFPLLFRRKCEMFTLAAFSLVRLG